MCDYILLLNAYEMKNVHGKSWIEKVLAFGV